jgi:plasmid maintenance system antidote protein VapI
LNEIVRGRRGITADTALRLARYLGSSPEFWLNLQTDYELRMARQTKMRAIERGPTTSRNSVTRGVNKTE